MFKAPENIYKSSQKLDLALGNTKNIQEIHKNILIDILTCFENFPQQKRKMQQA